MFEQMGGTYTELDGYRIPNLLTSTKEEKPLGIYGQRHLKYLKQHRRIEYTNLLTSGKLNAYLARIDKQALERI